MQFRGIYTRGTYYNHLPKCINKIIARTQCEFKLIYNLPLRWSYAQSGAAFMAGRRGRESTDISCDRPFLGKL